MVLAVGMDEQKGTSPAGLFHRLNASVPRSLDLLRARGCEITLAIGYRSLAMRRRRLCPREESNLQPCARPALPAYKAVALPIELLGQPSAEFEARSAVDSHHKPEGSHSLAPRPGPLVRLTLQIGQWSVVRGQLF